MIPIRLNLLSPQKRRFHQQAVFFQLIKNALEVLLIVVCISTSALVLAASYLEMEALKIESKTTLADSKHARPNQRIDAINKRIETLKTVSSKRTSWFATLKSITDVIPKGVSIDSLTINTDEKSVSIAGVAQTREILLALVQNINKLPWITSTVSIPSKALTEKEHLPFSFSLGIKQAL